jgi:hypothetical protein
MGTNGGSVSCAGATFGQHHHICPFFNGLDEEHRVLRSFVKEGFDRGTKLSTSWTVSCRKTISGGSPKPASTWSK